MGAGRLGHRLSVPNTADWNRRQKASTATNAAAGASRRSPIEHSLDQAIRCVLRGLVVLFRLVEDRLQIITDREDLAGDVVVAHPERLEPEQRYLPA